MDKGRMEEEEEEEKGPTKTQDFLHVFLLRTLGSEKKHFVVPEPSKMERSFLLPQGQSIINLFPSFNIFLKCFWQTIKQYGLQIPVTKCSSSTGKERIQDINQKTYENINIFSQMWRHTPIILVLRRLRQENWEFETSLAYLVRPKEREGMQKQEEKGKEREGSERKKYKDLP